MQILERENKKNMVNNMEFEKTIYVLWKRVEQDKEDLAQWSWVGWGQIIIFNITVKVDFLRGDI